MSLTTKLLIHYLWVYKIWYALLDGVAIPGLTTTLASPSLWPLPITFLMHGIMQLFHSQTKVWEQSLVINSDQFSRSLSPAAVLFSPFFSPSLIENCNRTIGPLHFLQHLSVDNWDAWDYVYD